MQFEHNVMRVVQRNLQGEEGEPRALYNSLDKLPSQDKPDRRQSLRNCLWIQRAEAGKSLDAQKQTIDFSTMKRIGILTAGGDTPGS